MTRLSRLAGALCVFSTALVPALARANSFLDPHHFEPALRAMMNEINGTPAPSCPTEAGDPAGAGADRVAIPRPADTGSAAAPTPESLSGLPTLLSDRLYKAADVCAEARRRAAASPPGRPAPRFALIAEKMHVCDNVSNRCFDVGRTTTDPCNRFVRRNFEVFHTRTYVMGKRAPGNVNGGDPQNFDELGPMEREYPEAGPKLVLIDLRDCRVLPSVVPRTLTDRGYSKRDLAPVNDPVTQFRDLRQDLLAAPGVRDALPPGEADAPDAELGCAPSEARVFPYPPLSNAGSNAYRTRMDVQFLAQFGLKTCVAYLKDERCRTLLKGLPPAVAARLKADPARGL